MPTRTSHQEKVERLIADLGKQGVSANMVAPPLFRLLWALGLRVPPPLFLGFVTLMLVAGSAFGLLWGIIMWFVQWQVWHVPAALAIATSVGAGLLFGVTLAGYYRWKAARLQLPSWDSYPGADGTPRRRS